MRISGWSSDVCSSDLSHELACADRRDRLHERPGGGEFARCDQAAQHHRLPVYGARRRVRRKGDDDPSKVWKGGAILNGIEEKPRSEEHTSELQSLMRISYAVFCLKKNTTTHNKPPHQT